MLPFDPHHRVELYSELMNAIAAIGGFTELLTRDNAVSVSAVGQPDRWESFTIWRMGSAWYTIVPPVRLVYKTCSLALVIEFCRRILDLHHEHSRSYGPPQLPVGRILETAAEFDFEVMDYLGFWKATLQFLDEFQKPFRWHSCPEKSLKILDRFESEFETTKPALEICAADLSDPLDLKRPCQDLLSLEQLFTMSLCDALKQCQGSDAYVSVVDEAGPARRLDPRKSVRKPFQDYWPISAGPWEFSLFVAEDFRFAYFSNPADGTIRIYGRELADCFVVPDLRSPS